MTHKCWLRLLDFHLFLPDLILMLVSCQFIFFQSLRQTCAYSCRTPWRLLTAWGTPWALGSIPGTAKQTGRAAAGTTCWAAAGTQTLPATSTVGLPFHTCISGQQSLSHYLDRLDMEVLSSFCPSVAVPSLAQWQMGGRHWVCTVKSGEASEHTELCALPHSASMWKRCFITTNIYPEFWGHIVRINTSLQLLSC